ncbi:hypothetical protein HZ996_05740 [Cryomorphaceae bacterium]|nr:hypothetical protein HZ996_05740 [Cryomorphaceae bacterium]
MKGMTLLYLLILGFTIQGQTYFTLDSTESHVRYIQAFLDKDGGAIIHEFKISQPVEWSLDKMETVTLEYRRPDRRAFRPTTRTELTVPITFNSCNEALYVHKSYYNRKANAFLWIGGYFLLGSAVIGAKALRFNSGEGTPYATIFGVSAISGGLIGLAILTPGIVIKINRKKREKSLVCPD